jgi:hypothetical protein
LHPQRQQRAKLATAVIGLACARAAVSPSLGMGLRLLERGAGAFQVIGGNHDLHAPEVVEARE